MLRVNRNNKSVNINGISSSCHPCFGPYSFLRLRCCTYPTYCQTDYNTPRHPCKVKTSNSTWELVASSGVSPPTAMQQVFKLHIFSCGTSCRRVVSLLLHISTFWKTCLFLLHISRVSSLYVSILHQQILSVVLTIFPGHMRQYHKFTSASYFIHHS